MAGTASAERFLEFTVPRPFGITFHKKDDKLAVKAVSQESNAETTGIRRGDTIVAVDWVESNTYDDLMAYLKNNKDKPDTRFKILRTLQGEAAGLRAALLGSARLHKGYTVYEIAVAHDFDSWKIYKRYSDFDSLHSKLSQKFQHALKIPAKCWGSNSESVITDRMQALHQYVKDLVRSHAAIDLVDAFLGDRGSLSSSDVKERFSSGFSLPPPPPRKEEQEASKIPLNPAAHTQLLAPPQFTKEKKLQEIEGHMLHRSEASISFSSLPLEAPPGYSAIDQDHPLEIRRREVETQLDEVTTSLAQRIEQADNLVTSQQAMCDILSLHSNALSESQANFKEQVHRQTEAMGVEASYPDELDALTAETEDRKAAIEAFKAQCKQEAAENKSKREELLSKLLTLESSLLSKRQMKEHIEQFHNGIEERVRMSEAVLAECAAQQATVGAFEHNMRCELQDLSEQQQKNQAKINDIESDMKEMARANEVTAKQLLDDLSEVNAELGALEHTKNLRETHSQNLSNQVVTAPQFNALRAEELERVQNANAEESSNIEDIEAQKRLLEQQLQDLHTAFQEETASAQGALNELVILSDRHNKYKQNLEQELEAATTKMEMLTADGLKHTASFEAFSAETEMVSSQLQALEQSVTDLEEAYKLQESILSEHDLAVKEAFLKNSHQLRLDEVDFSNKKEMLNNLEHQLQNEKARTIEINSHVAQLALMKHCHARCSVNSSQVDALLSEHEATLAKHKENKAQLEDELKADSQSLELQLQEIKSRIDLDNRCKLLRAQYAHELGVNTDSLRQRGCSKFDLSSSSLGSQMSHLQAFYQPTTLSGEIYLQDHTQTLSKDTYTPYTPIVPDVESQELVAS